MSSRKVRKVLLSYEMVSLDEEEFKDEDRRLTGEFEQDFELELLYLKELERPISAEELPFEPQEKPVPEVDPEIAALHALLKPLHRQMVAALHPDLNGDGFLEQFQQFQLAWDSGDFGTVISLAASLRIPFELSEETVKALETRIGRLSSRIASGKKTARWFWGGSQKTDKARNTIVQSLGIDLKKFEEWKSRRTPEAAKADRQVDAGKIKMLTFSG